MRWIHLTALVLLTVAAKAPAALFCVANPAALESALQVAASNDQDDQIRLRVGTYGLPQSGAGYAYFGDQAEAFDLDISGGWLAFLGNPCAFQGDDPLSTMINGENVRRALKIEVEAENSDVSVRLLTFINGKAPGDTSGGGLQLFYSSSVQSGLITIERNVFIANEANSGGGADVFGGLLQQVTNNLFLANNAIVGSGAAGFRGAEIGGIYFTNNTVLSNTTSSGSVDAVRLRSDAGIQIINNNFRDNDGYDVFLVWQPGDGQQVLRNNNIQAVFANGLKISENNINVEPVYESGLFNYTPKRNSPLVDAGIAPPGMFSFWYLTDVDLNGADRVVGSAVDIGAYENERIFVNGFETAGPIGS